MYLSTFLRFGFATMQQKDACEWYSSAKPTRTETQRKDVVTQVYTYRLVIFDIYVVAHFVPPVPFGLSTGTDKKATIRTFAAF